VKVEIIGLRLLSEPKVSSLNSARA